MRICAYAISYRLLLVCKVFASVALYAPFYIIPFVQILEVLNIESNYVVNTSVSFLIQIKSPRVSFLYDLSVIMLLLHVGTVLPQMVIMELVLLML